MNHVDTKSTVYVPNLPLGHPRYFRNFTSEHQCVMIFDDGWVPFDQDPVITL